MKLRYTPEAIRDLREIQGYIRTVLQNPAAAKRIGKHILDTCAILKDQPKAGASLGSKTNEKTDLRFLISEKYMIFYRVEKNTVSVARILDGRQDYLQLLFGEPKNE